MDTDEFIDVDPLRWSSVDACQYIGCLIRECLKNGRSVAGHLFAIDAATHAVLLTALDEKQCTATLLPAIGIRSMRVFPQRRSAVSLDDDSFDSALDAWRERFAGESTTAKKSADERKAAFCALLVRAKLPVRANDDGSLVVLERVHIAPPYTAEQCTCIATDEPLALARVRALLGAIK